MTKKVPNVLIALARDLKPLDPTAPVTLRWSPEGQPTVDNPITADGGNDTVWTYPNSATAFAVAWYCVVFAGAADQQRYQAVPGRVAPRPKATIAP